MQKQAKKYFKQLFKPTLREYKFKKTFEIKDDLEYERNYQDDVQRVSFSTNFSGYVKDMLISFKPNNRTHLHYRLFFNSLTGLPLQDIDLLYQHFMDYQLPFISNPNQDVETIDPLTHYDELEEIICNHLQNQQFKLTYNYKNMRSHPAFKQMYHGKQDVTDDLLKRSLHFESVHEPKQSLEIYMNEHYFISFRIELNHITKETITIELSFYPSFNIDVLHQVLHTFSRLYHYFDTRAKQLPIAFETLEDIYQNKETYIKQWKEKHHIVEGQTYDINDIYQMIQDDCDEDYKLSFAMFVELRLRIWNNNRSEKVIDAIVYDEKEKGYIYACHGEHTPYNHWNLIENLTREFIAVKRTGRYYNFYQNNTIKF